MRNDHVAELLVDLDHLEFHGLADVEVVIADRFDVDLRTGQECLDTEYVDDHTALCTALDVAFDYLVIIQSLVYTIPRLELTGLFVRQDQLTFFVLGAVDINLDLFAYGQFGVVAELADGDDTFALVADVNDNFAFVDVDNRSFNDFADLHLRKRLIVRFGNLIFGFVVEGRFVFECVPVEILVCDYFLIFFHK